MNYFGKPVQELTLAECASLISITNNPTIYGPYSDAVFTNSETGEQKTARDKNKERQELVLWSMLDQGYITQEEYDEAVAQELVFDRAAGESTPSTIYSWYEEQVISDVKDDLKPSTDTADEAVSLLLTRGGRLSIPVWTRMSRPRWSRYTATAPTWTTLPAAVSSSSPPSPSSTTRRAT